MKPKVYLAAPLFSEAEKTFNQELKRQLEMDFSVYLPQEDGMLVVELMTRGVSFMEASKRVFSDDVKAINAADILLIVLDGRTVDEGAAMELGYAYSRGKQCIGYSTDPRTLLQYGQNPMITGCLETTVHSVQELQEYLFQSQEEMVCELRLYRAQPRNGMFLRS